MEGPRWNKVYPGKMICIVFQVFKLSDVYIQREKAVSQLRSFLYKHDSYAIQTVNYEIEICEEVASLLTLPEELLIRNHPCVLIVEANLL